MDSAPTTSSPRRLALAAAAPPAPERPRWLSPLRVRLLLLVLLAWLPMVVLVVASSLAERARAMTSARQDLMRIVRTLAHRQQEHIDATRQLLGQVSAARDLGPDHVERVQSLCSLILGIEKAYADVGVADVQGRVFASGRPEPLLADCRERKFFQEVLANRKFVDSDYALTPRGRRPVLFMAQPVLGRENQLEAVIFAALRLDWICEYAPHIDLLEHSTLTVVDRQNQMLLRYPDSDKQWLRAMQTGRSTLEPLRLQSKEGAEQIRGPDGIETVHVYTALSTTGGFADAWTVASIPAAEVFSEARLLLVIHLAFLGFIGVLALGAAWFGGDVFVLQPVKSLAAATHRIRSGQFDVQPCPKHAPAELAELAQDFGIMARSLEQRIAEREQAEAQLRQLNEGLEQRVADRTRDLQRSNEELEQFAYVASHDLQEPLRMVTSYMQLLRQRYADKLDANARDFIGFAVDGAERMQQLITDLLAYSRVGTRQRPLEPADAGRVLEQALANLQVAIAESEVVVTHDPLPVVQGDAVQLGQLFQNLISNAIKFRTAQSPTVHVSARPTETCVELEGRRARLWEFAVRDNGIGIAPENFQRIFVIFQRLHGRGKYSGTGIGLAICKKIVERHGGRIWPQSAPGQGTCFYFTLPVANTTSARAPEGTAD